jgi:hypothetical protein
MQWINGVGKLKVTHRVKVPFAVDGYTDKVECDVLPLHVCHLLLGRPWQHDVNALHHGRTNRYTFMHKGEFYTLLPKEGKDIKCTVEVFKKKAARCRPKPRTVSFEGREDDKVAPAVDISQMKVSSLEAPKYTIPARRQQTKTTVPAKQLTHTMVGSIPIRITPADEVKPMFRTPCKYMYVGKASIQVQTESIKEIAS